MNDFTLMAILPHHWDTWLVYGVLLAYIVTRHVIHYQLHKHH